MSIHAKIDTLILNSPWQEPTQHWTRAADNMFDRASARRPSGYVAQTNPSDPNDPGTFVPIELVQEVIRPAVNAWRAAGFPGATRVTQRILAYWYEEGIRDNPFFFCQFEAIETLIWLHETPDGRKVAATIPGDGGQWVRHCSKMATGTGKTTVMAMILVWQVLNHNAEPASADYTNKVLVVAPNLTVKERLAVLHPSDPNNYYDKFRLIPPGMPFAGLELLIQNWQQLAWESEEKVKKKKGVDKRGALNDEAYVDKVLGKGFLHARNILVINDEAHHAWRINKDTPGGESKEEATVWVGGLDRIHAHCGILKCFDLSATPYTPSKSKGEVLYTWIVSDFGLNDAIESGLVKTPRVPIWDDSFDGKKELRTKLSHLYPYIKDDLAQKAAGDNLPKLPVLAQDGYRLLAVSWKKKYVAWQEAAKRHKTLFIPPVILSVANSTPTAARIQAAMLRDDMALQATYQLSELSGEEHTLRIDSVAVMETDTTEKAKALRKRANTVGKKGQPGEQVRHVISVGMLSEGWDASNVTHIMGLRAFSSQLLCEQVIGRGLRRMSYETDATTGLMVAEYVEVFGVPFRLLPAEGDGGAGGGDEPPPAQDVYPVAERAADFEIRFPNVQRIATILRSTLSLDIAAAPACLVDPIAVGAATTAATTADGGGSYELQEEISAYEGMRERTRLQHFIFRIATGIASKHPEWNNKAHIAQLIRLTSAFFEAGKVQLNNFNRALAWDQPVDRLILQSKQDEIATHLTALIASHNTERTTIVMDDARPVLSTGDMIPWKTRKELAKPVKSHINALVLDSEWESGIGYQLDKHPLVAAFVKNDHLGFGIAYRDAEGTLRRYRPDFIVRLTNKLHLIIEVKGKVQESVPLKNAAVKQWVDAVNADGRWGTWAYELIGDPTMILQRLSIYT